MNEKENHREIRMEDYRYDLPENRIAGYPVENRDESKLLVYRNDQLCHTLFNQLPDLLPPGSLIIWNNTRVIPARLQFNKATGALIEIFLLEPHHPANYPEIFNSRGTCEWQVIIGNQKKWKGEILEKISQSETDTVSLRAEMSGSEAKSTVSFHWTPQSLTFSRVLEIFGKTPIPPYLRRESEESDRTRYQTIYADFDGSVAAPTAGLHFTPQVLKNLAQKNIRLDSVTLHVGSGTFVPVKSETIGGHEMHAETVIISKSTIQNLLSVNPSELTVVGTTSLRSLESLYWLGVRLLQQSDIDPGSLKVDQWDPYQGTEEVSARQSLEAVIQFMEGNSLEEIEFSTRLIIVPGYKFRIVKRLITNFHQPSSTLLLLVSALIGQKWKEVYNYALSNDFRFLSYGDSSLLEIPDLNHGR